MEAFLSTLHVVGAVFIVGPMAILPMTAMRAIRAGQGAQVAVLARSTLVFSLLSLVVALLGFGIVGVSTHDTKISTPWVLVSIILYALAVGLNLVAVVPALRSASEHLLDAGAENLKAPDYRRIAIGSGVTSLLLVIVVVLMSWKPGG
jgi:uncharacterized membrane protein